MGPPRAPEGPSIPMPAAPGLGPPVPPPPAAPTAPDASRGPWSVREPGDPGGDATPRYSEPSWSGVRMPETSSRFDPAEVTSDGDDSWEERTEVGDTQRDDAEAHLARGDVRGALRIYQELSAQAPNDAALQDRVAEIAGMLRDSSV